MMNTQISRKKLAITGLIQGVGFRPFIYNLANKYALPGWAANTSEGVVIDVEGSATVLNAFIDELQTASPANSKIESLTITDHPACGYQSFELRESDFVNQTALFISPDIATCDACREEIFDPGKRRFQYAFTSCSHCGPRYSIISALPYDRVRTSMHTFALCRTCQDEYDNPADRRFHAQTIACPDCGPSLELNDNTGQCIARNVEAIEQTARLINQGCIVALKGIGGFQLLADAHSQSTIELLRYRKQRPDKPFAVMCRDLDQVKHCAEVTALETQLLKSTAAPIVLLGKNTSCAMIAEAVAPNNTRIGIMLPYSPLHHLLLGFLNRPLVATSGNVSNEPICIDNQQARHRLATIADYFLVHNRPILRPVDDSIVQQINGSKTILRAARGYAPMTITIRGNARSEEGQRNRLAVGGHLKNSVAVKRGDHVMIGQHNGDLDSFEAVNGFQQNIADLTGVLNYQPHVVMRDKHVDYASSQYAETLGLPVVNVQHHHAHLLSCMTEHHVESPLLGIIWDGAGLGDDDTLWGGEFFTLENKRISRVASLRDFPLPGGTMAIKEPRRTALGMLWECLGNSLFEHTNLAPVKAFKAQDRMMLQQMLSKQLHSPRCSSMGRLFDCVSSLLDVCQISSFEGQAAMYLEQAITDIEIDDHYPLLWSEDSEPARFDWEPLLRNIIDDLSKTVPKQHIARKFHNTLIEIAVQIATKSVLKRVVLSGGSFQNRYLTESIISRLSALGLKVYWHQQVPTNDGGLALGQLVAIDQIGTDQHVFSYSR